MNPSRRSSDRHPGPSLLSLFLPLPWMPVLSFWAARLQLFFCVFIYSLPLQVSFFPLFAFLDNLLDAAVSCVLFSFCVFCFHLFVYSTTVMDLSVFLKQSFVAPPPYCMCFHTPVPFSVLPACKFSVPCLLDFFLRVVRSLLFAFLAAASYVSFFVCPLSLFGPFPSCPRSAPDPEADAETIRPNRTGNCLHSQRLRFDTGTGH